MDPRLTKLADVLVNYSVSVQPGQMVAVLSPIEAEPLAVTLTEAILRAGGHPIDLFQSEDVRETLLRQGSDEQVAFVSPLATLMIEKADALIAFFAPSNTHALASIDPAKLALQNTAMSGISERMMQRTAEGTLRWTATQYPTRASAQDAGMSLRDYENFVFGAGLLEEADPAAAWQRQRDRQQRFVDWLSTRSEVHITGPGTDLRVNVEGRTWLNDDGHVNFPGGEVFTGPIEDSANGTIAFNNPAFYNGREVTGVQLRFVDGQVVEHSAQGDEAFLDEMLSMDEGAKRLGEFAFGTNPGIQRFTKNTLFDEKIGGTLHMALGRSYPESGGTNVSSLHWDMVYDLRNGGEVRVDGELFSRDGEIVIGHST